MLDKRPGLSIALILLFPFFVLITIFLLLPPDHRPYACSAGFHPVCIRAESRDDFIIKDGCLVNRHDPHAARLCHEYKIYR